MYLKRLESVGFKSFAERIKVDFVPGITAVVGPNGSGKSNITDAIRWVLGEQSIRTLRGIKMEDIIFQGSDSRRSLNVAEVTLVLDNHKQTLPLAFDEVSITRRIYRSGASEFYINKEPCRLRDIIDLFLDSGLGSGAFSIIGQGQVEEILSSKAEERRSIFEEAAGVRKYKQRKLEAEYKLAETDENLNRVKDIIYEIEQQLQPLEKQAEIAKQYLEKCEQLKTEEISLLITEIEQLHDQWQKLLKEIEVDRLVEIEKKTSIQTLEADIESKQHQGAKIDQKVERLQAKLLQETKRLEQLEGEKQLNHERFQHLKQNKDALQSEVKAVYEEKNKLEWAMKKVNEALNNLKEKKVAIAKSIKEHRQHLQFIQQSTISYEIAELKAEYIECLNEQAANHNEQRSLQAQKERIKSREVHQQSLFNAEKETKNTLTEKLENIKNHQKKIQEQMEQKRKIKEKLYVQLKSHQESHDQIKRSLKQMKQKMFQQQSRLETLEEMKNEYQGFYRGAKAVLQAKMNGDLENIEGAIIELIDIPVEYVEAIETVLGSRAQYIVVSDEKSARQAIAWLKETKGGWATFLPLQSIQRRQIPSKLLKSLQSHPGYLTIASKLVHTKPKYMQAIDHLMGNVIVAQDLRAANEMAKQLQYRYQIVTVQGEIVHPGGSMSGGTKGRSKHSLFTREKSIHQAEEQLKTLKTEINKHQTLKNESEATIEKFHQKIHETTKQLEAQRELFQQLKAEEQQCMLQLKNVKEQIDLYEQTQNQYFQDLEHIQNEEKRLKAELERTNETLEQIQLKVDRLTEQEKNLKDRESHLEQRIHQKEINLAEYDERIKNQREKLKQLEEDYEVTEEKYIKLKKDLHKLTTNEQLVKQETNLAEKIQHKKEIVQEITEKIQTKRKKRLQLTEQIEDENRELKEEKKQYDQFIRALQQKELEASRYDVALENKLSHLQTEYTITYEKATQTYEKAMHIEKTKENVQSLKQSIEQLGAVNLGAIDELKRITERHTFLTEQKKDLVEAKERLFSIIEEMDTEMEKRFSTTFSQINEQFTSVFKELFGGGKANLQLTDPKNLLDTGIEIIAQPPGKKLQNLSLLSGGERALTAIALLFAILRVRPVPFCVLDEVEASLDEANIARFAKYLKLHRKNTQFIVITHQKGTMEVADVLYGMTMQESGVSRLVSVVLEDATALVES